MLTTKDIIVALYFFLLLFKFLYAISPPTLKTLLITFGHFILLDLIFMSFELLIKSIGVTFDAFLAEDTQDRNIVIAATSVLISIAGYEISYINLKLFNTSASIKFTTLSNIIIATIPEIIPRGIPN